MKRKAAKVIAEICLYGTQTIGAGWIAQLDDGRMLGNGEPKEGRSFTEAMWVAADSVRQVIRPETGLVRIFTPGGERMAVCDVARLPYFGQLEWVPADCLVLDVAQLEAAAV